MRKPAAFSSVVILVAFCASTSAIAAEPKMPGKPGGDKPAWKNPLVKKGRPGLPAYEMTPFVFNGRLYLMKNRPKFFDLPGSKPGTRFMEDEVRITDVKTGKLVSTPLTAHAFATALVDNGRIYVFAGKYPTDKPCLKIKEISMTSSDDLKNWTKPVAVIKSERDEILYNTAVCRATKNGKAGKGKYVLLYETDDSRWPAFTFKYCTSDDLVNWTRVPGAFYGIDKYVGGPAIYSEGDYYYTLYLQSLPGKYETRITRSTDLVNWQDAPTNRPFLAPNLNNKNIPFLDPSVHEINASDPELCYFEGKTIVYFSGSIQQMAGDLQWATFKGTPRELFEHFFK